MNLSVALCIIYAGLLFGASSVPGNRLPGLPAKDFVLHILAYAGFGAVLFSCLSCQRQSRLGVTLWYAVVLASVYGLTDEWHQRFVPGRTTSASDWVADTAGAAAGAFALMLVRMVWIRHRAKSTGS